MPLPPRGNPRRPLFLAMRSMRAVGVVCLAPGLFGFIRYLPWSLTMIQARHFGEAFAPLLPAVPYLLPGIGYFVCAKYIAQRRVWAIVLSLVLTSLLLLFAIAALAFLTVVLLDSTQPPPLAFVLISGGILLLFVPAFVQLIYHLIRSFESIKYPPEEAPGFEVTLIAPAPQPPR